MKVTTEATTLATPGCVVDEVTAVIHRPTRPSRPAFLLTHGAGGDLDSAGLAALAEAIAERGHLVIRANLPYREAGRKGPPRATSTADDFATLFETARQYAPRTPWVVGGKSFGGRVASLAVARGLPAAGLLFYGYPLHPPGKPEKLRTSHWPDVPVPCLFLQGSKDTFTDPGLLEENLRRFPRRAWLHIVKGGDHSLRVSKAASPDGNAIPPSTVLAGLGDVVQRWIDERVL